MTRPGTTTGGRMVIALALTWDGARWPVQALPPKARAFLARNSRGAAAPSARKLAKLFAEDRISEIRVCWVPRLKGGDRVLSESFQTEAGKKLGFRCVKAVRFGDVLGVIYLSAIDKPLRGVGRLSKGSGM